ncbi:hypothetical protein FACS1894193_09290 [Bacilli bacterium]|nr:hypothetical protein FACS1894193_09290 [Bacilli bacterium]
MNVSYQKDESWTILSPIEQSIKAKIEAVGTPLKDWDISINYGIKTGFNEAFIVSEEKRQEILDNCQSDDERTRTAEIIRPILRGRDIKKYDYSFANFYLIYIPWHFPLQNDSSIQGVSIKAEKLFLKEYPAVYNHLLQYKESLSSRNKAETGIRYEWYALQRWGANYWDDFSKPKIAWNRIASKKVFGIVDKGIYIQDSMHFITGEHLEYLVVTLNSKLFVWLMNSMIGESAGGNAGNADNVKMLNILKPTKEIDTKISNLLINNDFEAIDDLLYVLYSLTDEEINWISSSVNTSV